MSHGDRSWPPRAVLFDFGGTLDAAGLPWKERVFRLYREAGVAVAAERFDLLFYGADDALVGAVSPKLSFRETVRRLVTGVGAALHADDELSERLAARFVDDALATIDANTGLLARLARRYRLGIVSNFYGNLATVCQETGIRPLVSVIVDSNQVGWSKPDPRIFRCALDELGVKPEEAAFVGDSLTRDMMGARGVAMPHIWLIGEGASNAEPCCPGDRVIRSLAELAGFLL